MIKMPLVTLGLLGSMVFGSCVQASTMLLEGEIIGEDSVSSRVRVTTTQVIQSLILRI